MDTGTMFTFLDVLVIGAGAYLLYAFYLLKYKKEIRQGVLIPKDVNPKSCKDIEGYTTFMSPKIIALGIGAMLSGGVGLYNDAYAPVNAVLYWVVFVLFFAAIAWFVYGTKKANERFF